jgi:putative photosynthetic complex assembly protein 2
LFFGVPRVNVEFVPATLAHLTSHFKISALNWFFPFSVTILTFALACWIERLLSVDLLNQVIGFTLLSSLTAMALLEHWVMVLPIPDAKLWRWMLPQEIQKEEHFRRKDYHGL